MPGGAMPRATRFLLGFAVLLGAIAAASAARHQCKAEVPPLLTREQRGVEEPDGDDVSLMALKFAVSKSAPAVLERRKATTQTGSSTSEVVTDAADVSFFADTREQVAELRNAGDPGVREADEPTHRGHIPLPVELFSLLASSSAVIFVGCNDVVWFLPFVMHSRRWQFVALYLVLKEFFAVFSWFVVAFGHRLESLYPGVPVERVLAIACPALLTLYALVLFLEWYEDTEDAPDSTPAREPGSPTKYQRHSELPTAAGYEQRLDLAKLGALCIIGNLDNLAVFIPGLEGGMFKGPQLLIGTFFSGVFVVAACVGATRIQSVARVVEAVPLWCILAALALWYSFRFMVDDKRRAAFL